MIRQEAAHEEIITMPLNAARNQTLCQQADIPDKSGELLTRQGADGIIDELHQKAPEHNDSSRRS
jgi:hypothetical protein